MGGHVITLFLHEDEVELESDFTLGKCLFKFSILPHHHYVTTLKHETLIPENHTLAVQVIIAERLNIGQGQVWYLSCHEAYIAFI